MNNHQQKSQKQNEKHSESMSCCGDKRMSNSMEKCFSKCRYMPLFPVVLGIVLLLLLGYFLSPEVTRVLWMVAAGLIVVMGLFGLIICRRIAAGISSGGCC